MPVTGPAALDEQPRRRRVLLLAVPWALAAVLGATALVTRPTATTQPVTGPSSATATATDGAAPAATPSQRPTAAAAGPDLVPPESLAPSTHLQVLAAARVALGTAGLTGVTGPAGRWATDVRLVEVSEVTDDLAVATVHALVIQLDDSGWTAPTTAAAAVPLVLSPEPSVAGPAWPLPAPRSQLVEPDVEAVPDPGPAVVAPLEAAGWAVDEVTAVDLVGGAVLRLRLLGVPPGSGERGEHLVWLLDAPGGPRLLPLGTTPTTQEST